MRKPGLSVRHGKPSQRPYHKVSITSQNLAQRFMRGQISGTLIGDSSIQNQNRVLLLQQELTAKGVWEVGKWMELLTRGTRLKFLLIFAHWRTGIRLERTN
ncbi:hypothetical protein Ancab_017224, partial [Ancistrocladus abbreviatus]